MNLPSPASFNYYQEALIEFATLNHEHMLEHCHFYSDEVERILVEAENIPKGFLIND